MKKILYSFISLMLAFCSGCGSTSVVTMKSSEEDYSSSASVDGTSSTDEGLSDTAAQPQKSRYAVYVCGAVRQPDVYYVEEGSIVKDVLLLAGGFDEGACEWYVNLAEYVKDGARIYFPYESEIGGENVPIDASGQSDISVEEKKVNINTADKEELMSLNGVGESRAEAIVRYREEFGGFRDISEICNVSGIKEGLYNKIKDYITVD